MRKQPGSPSVAEFYHQQTIYSPDNLGSYIPDPAARPDLFREFVSDRAIHLSTYIQRDADEEHHDDSAIGRIARLLFHTAGITLIHETGEGPLYFRAAPSAGGLYPIDVHIATRGLDEIPDGIHAYSVLRNELVPLWEGDFSEDIEELCFHHSGSIRANAFLLFTGVFQRSAWRYRERAYRRILLDAGHMLGNAVGYATTEGFQVVTIAGFYDSAFNDLLFLDTREEALILVAPLIDLQDVRDTKINSPFPFPSAKNPHDHTEIHDDGVMRLLHRRSEIIPDESLFAGVPTKPMSLARPRPPKDSETVFLLPEGKSALPDPHKHNLGQVIRRRRSTRKFSPENITLSALEKILRYGYDSAARYWTVSNGLPLTNCTFADPTLLTTYVVILRVEDVDPGVYLFDPETRSLHLLRTGYYERDLATICLHQDLGRDCSAAVVHMANLSQAVRRYGDRAYRYIHLDSGHIGQRLNLAATGLGLGASGIGGFYDSDVNRLLGLSTSTGSGLVTPEIATYITVLGTPANA